LLKSNKHNSSNSFFLKQQVAILYPLPNRLPSSINQIAKDKGVNSLYNNEIGKCFTPLI
jgi:hypothetical protein